MKKICNRIKAEIKDTFLLLKNVPAIPFVLFVLSIVMMNLLAGKLIVDLSWLALDAGIIVSWLSFMGLDMIVRRFGPKASSKLLIVALMLNVLVVSIFSLAALIPGDWALNEYSTSFSWWIIGVSTLAFLVGGIVSNILHWIVRKLFKKENKDKLSGYVVSSWVSTTVAQFVDNLLFGVLFTMIAFQLDFLPVLMCAFTGMVVELLCQVIFTPLGYKVSERWRKQNVGVEYIEHHPELLSEISIKEDVV